MNKESQKGGARVESTGVEVDVSEWTIEDWLKDHKEAPKQESYKTGEGTNKRRKPPLGNRHIALGRRIGVGLPQTVCFCRQRKTQWRQAPPMHPLRKRRAQSSR